MASLPTGLRASSGCAEMELPLPGLWLKRLWVLFQVALHVAMGKVLMTLFPGRVKQDILAMSQKTGMAKNPHFSHENWIPTFFSAQYFWFVLKVRWQRLEDKTEEGGLAPNCPVVSLSGQRCHIWDFMQGQEGGPSSRGAWTWALKGGGQVGWKVQDAAAPTDPCWLLVPFLLLETMTSSGFSSSEWPHHLP